jgi:23S rRNA (adenine-N6)-dimethyltransferase
VAGRRARSARPPSRHFLRRNLAAEVVRDSGAGARDLVLDLGAGSGRLTAELARVCRRVVAVELDPQLAEHLRSRRWKNVDVFEGDATTVELPREPFRVVANLPFSRTNDLLHLLLDDPRTPLVRADLVVEWGVAVKRAVPWPSSVSGVLWSATYEISISRRLPPGAFEPPPSVSAGVLVFRRRDAPLVSPEHGPAYHRFVARGFRHGSHARDLDAYQWASRFNVRSHT